MPSNVHFCRPAASVGDVQRVAGPTTSPRVRSNSAYANGLPPVVGRPGTHGRRSDRLAVGVPKPIVKTLLNDRPCRTTRKAGCRRSPGTRTLFGVETTRVSVPAAPSVLYQTPPDVAPPAPAIQNSVPLVRGRAADVVAAAAQREERRGVDVAGDVDAAGHAIHRRRRRRRDVVHPGRGRVAGEREVVPVARQRQAPSEVAEPDIVSGLLRAGRGGRQRDGADEACRRAFAPRRRPPSTRRTARRCPFRRARRGT